MTAAHTGPLDALRDGAVAVLKTLIGSRRILLVTGNNWAQVDFLKILTASPWLKALYRIRPMHFRAIRDAGLPMASGLPPLDLAAADYREVSCGSYLLWELAKSGILASLEQATLPDVLGEREQRVVRHCYEFVRLLALGARRVIAEFRPDTVVLAQGCTPMSRPILEAARDAGLNLVAAECSFLGDYFICDNATGMLVNRHQAGRLDWDWLPSRIFSADQQAAFRARLARAQTSKRDDHKTGAAAAVPPVREALRIPTGNRIAVFIGQVLTDSSILFDSPVFPNPVALILKVAAFFRSRPGWSFVIRLHPKERTGVCWANSDMACGPPPGEPAGFLPYNDLTMKRCLAPAPDLAKSAIIVPGTEINTSALTAEADVGVTINSQAGFEMALQGRRVVVCGDAFYGRKGFTCDVSNDAALEPVLDAACRAGAMSERECLIADQFGDHLMRSVMFRKDMKGEYARLLRVNEPGPFRGLRRLLADRAIAALDGAEQSAPV